MKFSPFVYDYIVSDDWEFLENMTGYNDPKEYFGFELPFTEKDLWNENWEEFRNYLEDWVHKHQLDVIDSKVTYYDLEKGYEDVDTVFSFEGKFYKISYYTSWFYSPYKDGYPSEAREVFPQTKTIEVTEYR